MAATTPMSLLLRPATELAELVREGEVSSRELVEESLARVEAQNGELGGFTLVDAEGALAAADAVEPGDSRPFAGVPIALKDLGLQVEGMRLTNGSDLFGDFVPRHHGFVTRRLREAGFVFVGRTNSPELGILPVTEPRRFPPSRNPWDPSRTPGGSSGGSGAAVAAGMVPLAHGSDGGGSIRIPAACCGLVGLKPQRGRISRGPEAGDSFLATDGVLTRTVADTAALLDVLAGYEPGDATWAPPPGEPYSRAVGREPGKLRIALGLAPPVAAEVDPAYSDGARRAGELLESLGHEVEEVDPPYRVEEMVDLFTNLWSAVASLGVLWGANIAGRAPAADDVERLTWWLHERAMGIPAGFHMAIVTRLQRAARDLVAWFEQYDVLLTPMLARSPLPVGTIDGDGADPEAEFEKAWRFTPYTAIWNVTGQPAISLPLFQHEDGLPLGVQLVGRPLGEDVLLALAAQLEAARPWAGRVAPMAAASASSQ